MPAVDVGVIEQFLHPPIGVCTLLFEGSHTGSVAISRPAGPVGVDAFGILYSVTLEPPGAGQLIGQSVIYEQRVVQVVVDHTMIGGINVISQRYEGYEDSALIMFTQALPTDVRLWITPGFEIDVYWVVIA